MNGFFLNMYSNQVRFMENQYTGSDFDEGEGKMGQNPMVVSTKRNSTVPPSAGIVAPFSTVRLSGCHFAGMHCMPCA